MRRFSNEEIEVLRILNNSNGLTFQHLIIDKIIDCNITIKRGESKVEVFYLTQGFTPSPNEIKNFTVINNELFRRIYLAVTLVNYFEKEGLVGLYQNKELKENVIIGRQKQSELGLYSPLPDKTIKELLLSYTDKILLVTSEYNEFAKNGFVSREELRQIRSNRLAWYGILIAFLSSIISGFFSFLEYQKKEVERPYIYIIKSEYNHDKINNNLQTIKNIIIENNKNIDSLLKIHTTRLNEKKRRNKANYR